MASTSPSRVVQLLTKLTAVAFAGIAGRDLLDSEFRTVEQALSALVSAAAPILGVLFSLAVDLLIHRWKTGGVMVPAGEKTSLKRAKESKALNTSAIRCLAWLVLLPLVAVMVGGCASDPAHDFTTGSITDSSPRNVQGFEADGTFGQSNNNQAESVEMQFDFMKLLGSGVQTKLAARALGLLGSTSAGVRIKGGRIKMAEEPVVVPSSMEGAEEVYPVLDEFEWEELEILPAEGNEGLVAYVQSIAPYYQAATVEQRLAYETNVKAWVEAGKSAFDAIRTAAPILFGMPPIAPPATP